MTLHTEALAAFATHGWGSAFIPLRGKIPSLEGWSKRDPATQDEVLDWLDAGFSGLGLRTGAASGVFVVDIDAGSDWDFTPPEGTPVVDTPGGGQHLYFQAPDPCPGNTASKLAPHVDTRGEGGQVLYPGSRHPNGGTYQWVRPPSGPLPVLPAEILAALEPKPVPAPANRARLVVPRNPMGSHGTCGAYAATALARETVRVSTAAEGARNHSLNRAAFSLGQLVAGGELTQDAVVDSLTAAAVSIGLTEREILATIRSGLSSGALYPREKPNGLRAPDPNAAPRQPGDESTPKPDVLCPGSHVTPTSEYLEIGQDRFSATLIRCLPDDLLFRRGSIVGEVLDGQFVPVGAERMRGLTDRHVRVVVGKAGQGDDDPPKLHFRPCSRDAASVVVHAAAADGGLKELHHLATHPFYVRDRSGAIQPAKPGWNPGGSYLAGDPLPAPLDVDSARLALCDLVCDFPFQERGDLEHFLGLLLTPLLRPVLGTEPVPLHLITSPQERTGKTKLAEIVLGGILLGQNTPAMQLGRNEEEREKRIMASLISGISIIHLDNVDGILDSPSLASMLTCSTFHGRLLGKSQMMNVPNRVTLVASGNQVQASGELAKRMVPIRLQASCERPEERQDFRHPDLPDYVETRRGEILGALAGLVSNWQTMGQPLGPLGFGGFDRWFQMVGGIMHAAGFMEWGKDLASWRTSTSAWLADAEELIAAWDRKWGGLPVRGAEVYELAKEMELFDPCFSGKTERGCVTSFGMRVLNRLAGRMFGDKRIESTGRGSSRTLQIRPLPLDSKVGKGSGA